MAKQRPSRLPHSSGLGNRIRRACLVWVAAGVASTEGAETIWWFFCGFVPRRGLCASPVAGMAPVDFSRLSRSSSLSNLQKQGESTIRVQKKINLIYLLLDVVFHSLETRDHKGQTCSALSLTQAPGPSAREIQAFSNMCLAGPFSFQGPF